MARPHRLIRIPQCLWYLSPYLVPHYLWQLAALSFGPFLNFCFVYYTPGFRWDSFCSTLAP